MVEAAAFGAQLGEAVGPIIEYYLHIIAMDDLDTTTISYGGPFVLVAIGEPVDAACWGIQVGAPVGPEVMERWIVL